MERVTKKVNKSNKKVNKNDLNNNQRRKYMKIKLFYYRSWKQTLEDFEREVNDFMATVAVVDVKYSEATVGNSEDIDAITCLMVLYK